MHFAAKRKSLLIKLTFSALRISFSYVFKMKNVLLNKSKHLNWNQTMFFVCK